MSYFENPTGKPSEAGRMVAIDSDLPALQLASGLSARPLLGHNLMASFVRYEADAAAPRHSHVEEQLFVVLEGELELELDGDVRRMRPGDAALIPAWAPHSVRASNGPAYQLDVFSPPRAALLAIMADAELGHAKRVGEPDVESK